MRTVIAIDPGTTQSAFIVIEGDTIHEHGIIPNYELAEWLSGGDTGEDGARWYSPTNLVIEMVASYGKAVGEEVFETCVWIGKFIRSYGFEEYTTRIKRNEVKMHLCHATAKVTDAVIRQRIIDLYGGKKEAIGNKKNPGPLYGIKADVWQALALAITWREKYGTATV